MSNVFATIALSDATCARVLALAFTSSRDMDQVYACLRFARQSVDYVHDYFSWLAGAAFMAHTNACLCDPREMLEGDNELYEATVNAAWEYLAEAEQDTRLAGMAAV